MEISLVSFLGSFSPFRYIVLVYVHLLFALFDFYFLVFACNFACWFLSVYFNFLYAAAHLSLLRRRPCFYYFPINSSSPLFISLLNIYFFPSSFSCHCLLHRESSTFSSLSLFINIYNHFTFYLILNNVNNTRYTRANERNTIIIT